MPVKLLIALGISTITGVIAEKVLNEIGMTEEADIVDKTNKTILTGGVIGSLVYVLVELNKLKRIL